MRKLLLTAAIAVIGISVAVNVMAAPRHHALHGHPFTKTAAVMDAHGAPYGLSTDCTLANSNFCAGWIWVFNSLEGSEWGAVLNSSECPGGCVNGGAVSEIILYSRCTAAPGTIDNLGVTAVDAVDCPSGSPLYASGPVTVTHCVSGDRWTTFQTPLTHTFGNPFAVTITFGPQSGGSNNPAFATDNGISNLYCSQGIIGSPGCASTAYSCAGWTLPPQRTFIYITDFNGDGILDDLCALYGAPYPLSFPYFYPYGYLPNNLVVSVGLDCSSPTAVENSSWGHVKALYQ